MPGLLFCFEINWTNKGMVRELGLTLRLNGKKIQKWRSVHFVKGGKHYLLGAIHKYDHLYGPMCISPTTADDNK